MAHPPEIVLYQDANFGGREWRTHLGYTYVGDTWNDTLSSLIIVSGTWQFWRHANYQSGAGDRNWVLGPGYYSWVEAVGIPNDQVSSLRPIAWTT